MTETPLSEAMEAVRPGLWRWAAPHPHWRPYDPVRKRGWDWEEAVSCVCYETAERLVLIDPLAPAPSTAARKTFWRALDEEIRRRGQPVAVLLSSDWHDRSAQAVFDRYQERYRATVWAPAAALK